MVMINDLFLSTWLWILFISYNNLITPSTAERNISKLLLSTNSHPRFPKVQDRNSDKTQSHQSLFMFIAITSSPHHGHLRHAIRNTWSIPCKLSSHCDYRFFIDASSSSHHSNSNNNKMTTELLLEQTAYHDMIFRDACPRMKRHPSHINYGNSPPIGENLFYFDNNHSSPTFGQHLPNPDYPSRRFYKIDWKVCFMDWVFQQQYGPITALVFVEDDSFVCTENMLYQFDLLRNISHDQHASFLFRTGTPLFDGFDDSSTILDGELAFLFSINYPSVNLNCDSIESTTDEQKLNSTFFLSWGNSWMKTNCAWLDQLQHKMNITDVRLPLVACTNAKISHGEVEFPCLDQPLVLHHQRASHLLLKQQSENRVKHLCEYMWLIDKVKSPEDFFLMWNLGSVSNRFHNFTAIFTAKNDKESYGEILHHLEEEESQERNDHVECSSTTAAATSHSGGKKFPCLFESNITWNLPATTTTSEKKKRRRSLSSLTTSSLSKDKKLISYKEYYNLSFIMYDD